MKKIRLVQETFEVFGKKSEVNCVVKTQEIGGTSIQIFENMSQLKMLKKHSKDLGLGRLPQEIQIDQQKPQPVTGGHVFWGGIDVVKAGYRSYQMHAYAADTLEAFETVGSLVAFEVPVVELFGALTALSGFTYPVFLLQAIHVCPYAFTSK